MFNRKKDGCRCPGDEIIACYVDGILSEPEKVAIDKHMLLCNKCRENIGIQKDVAKLQESLGVGFVPSYVTEKAKGLLKERVGMRVFELAAEFSDQMFEALKTTGEILLGPKKQPVFLLRDSTAKVSKVLFVKKVFGNIRIDVELMRSENDLNSLNLTFKDDKTGTPVVDLRVTLINNDIELESYITQNGKVIFESIKQGKYKIDISKVDSFVGVIVLELNKK